LKCGTYKAYISTIDNELTFYVVYAIVGATIMSALFCHFIEDFGLIIILTAVLATLTTIILTLPDDIYPSPFALGCVAYYLAFMIFYSAEYAMGLYTDIGVPLFVILILHILPCIITASELEYYSAVDGEIYD